MEDREGRVVQVGELAERVISHVQWVRDRKKHVGLRTGYVAIDRVIGSLFPCDKVAVIGKAMPVSAVLRGIACFAARAGAAVLYVPLGRSRDDVVTMMLAGEARVPRRHVKEAFCSETELVALAKAKARMDQWGLIVAEAPDCDCIDLSEVCPGHSFSECLVVVDGLSMPHSENSLSAAEREYLAGTFLRDTPWEYATLIMGASRKDILGQAHGLAARKFLEASADAVVGLVQRDDEPSIFDSLCWLPGGSVRCEGSLMLSLDYGKALDLYEEIDGRNLEAYGILPEDLTSRGTLPEDSYRAAEDEAREAWIEMHFDDPPLWRGAASKRTPFPAGFRRSFPRGRIMGADRPLFLRDRIMETARPFLDQGEAAAVAERVELWDELRRWLRQQDIAESWDARGDCGLDAHEIGALVACELGFEQEWDARHARKGKCRSVHDALMDEVARNRELELTLLLLVLRAFSHIREFCNDRG